MEEPSYTHSDELIHRICTIIQNGPTCLPFLQHCLVFCLLHVGDPQAIIMLQQRDSATWQSIILSTFWYEESGFTRKWSAYCVGRILHLSEPGIPTTLLDEPWDDSQEDITPAKLRCIYSFLFDVELGEPRIFGESEQQRLGISLEKSELFKDTPLPNTSELYDTMSANIPIFLPIWFTTIPPGLIPNLGIRALLSMRAFVSDAEARCPSLNDHKACFLLVLVFHGLYLQETNCALDEWTTSPDGQNFYHSLMNTFWSTKEPAEYLLILAVFLRIPPYRNMSTGHGAHQPSNDPLLDLGTFVEGQGPIDRRVILEKTAFSAIRVLMDKNFNRRFKRPRRREHIYLSTVLRSVLGTKLTMLGCLEGTLDHYCKARIDDSMDHPKAFNASLIALSEAERLARGFSCSRVTSSTTLNDKTSEPCKAQEVHFQSDLVIEAGSLRAHGDSSRGGSSRAMGAVPGGIVHGRTARKGTAHARMGTKQVSDTPEHVCTIHFLGQRGVGKTGIINRAVNDCYVKEYNPTFDHDRHSKTFRVNGKVCKLDIVDNEGQDDCSTPKQMHMENKDVLILVYDTTRRRSFEDIPHIFNAHVHLQDVIIVLVGNKIDLGQKQEVSEHEGVELARKLGAFFYEVSALKGDGINEMFRGIACLVLRRECSGLDGAMDANADTSEKSYLDLETSQSTSQSTFWNSVYHLLFPCMGRA